MGAPGPVPAGAWRVLPPGALAGRVAVVTGGSRGIGRAICLALGAAGARVVVNYRAAEEAAAEVVAALEALAGPGEPGAGPPGGVAAPPAELASPALPAAGAAAGAPGQPPGGAAGRRAIAVRADVSREEEAEALIQAAVAHFGRLDILVNNAGVAYSGLLMDMRADDWRRVMAVNLDGAFFCCRAALPHMVRARWGRIINVSSIWGLVGAANEVAYSAAKAGLIGFTKALAKEVAAAGITVNCVAPGIVRTDMLAGYRPEELDELAERTPAGRLGLAEEMAAAVAFLASEAAAFITGQVLSPNGGLVT